jgi:cysteine synthase/rhodanese-related sulfurtransferase
METIKGSVFEGEKSIQNFLNPVNIVTPLVELPKDLNRFQDQKVRIFAKRMDMTPLGNVKSLPAFNMLEEAFSKGDLRNIEGLVESSSGNTAASLAVVGRAFGINKTTAIVSREVTPDKLALLKFFGVDIQIVDEPICPNYEDPESGIHKAKIMAENGWFNPGQYDNLANPLVHQKYTGPQIWEQTGRKISLFCAGLGTTGTMVGVSRFLKSKSPDVKTLGIIRAANNPVPGVRTESLLKEVAFDWRKAVDYLEPAGSVESYQTSLDLCRRGLVVGPSSGFALAGLNNFLEKKLALGELNALRNSDGFVNAVFICPDTPYPYINEYLKYASPTPKLDLMEMGAEEVYKAIISNQKLEILDTRFDFEFEDYHIDGAKNIPYEELFSYAQRLSFESLAEKRKQRMLVVCAGGEASKYAVTGLRGGFPGIDPYSLKGGMLEWSRLNLPRVKSVNCTGC